MKQRKKRIRAVIPILALASLFTLVLILLPAITIKASGFMKDDINFVNLYSRYYLDNYQLDFYVDTSWSWLPWNWLDGIGRSVMYGIHCISNGMWILSTMISCATGEAVGEAYRLDFINDLADTIGKNMQTLAGISPSGVSTKGFYSGFMLLIILAVGVYVVYVGLIKRESSKAIGAVVNMLVIFILSAGFIAYAPQYIKSINEFSSDVSTGALTLGTSFTMPGTVTGGEDSVDRIRDNLFSIQVYQPWLILQYGTSDINTIGESRVENLLSTSPESEYGASREAVVIEEIETYGNTNVTITNVVSRFGKVLLILIVNLLISIFVLLLAGMMVLSQILFIIYAMFLPVSFVLAMFPTYGGMAKKAVMKVFNIIMMRAGLTLIVTVAFCVSGMIYSIASNYSFFMTAYLQVVVFAGIFMKSSDLLGMFSLQDDGSGKLQKSMFWNYLTTMVVRDKVNDMRYANRQGKRSKKLAAEQARKAWFEDRAIYQRRSRQQKTEPLSEEQNRRYRVAEQTPGLRWYMDSNNVASTEFRMNVDSESMEQYRGVESLRRKMYGSEENVTETEQMSPRWSYRVAEQTPGLRWHVKDGEAVTETRINTDGQSLKKYREKDALKRWLDAKKVKDTVEPEKAKNRSRYRTVRRTSGPTPQVKEDGRSFNKYREKDVSKRQPNAEMPKDKEEPKKVKPVSKYRVSRRTPGLAPQVDNDVITAGAKISADGRSFNKYREKDMLKRQPNVEMPKDKEEPKKVKLVSKYRVSRRTPGLAPQVDNDVITAGAKISADGRSFNKYREKDMLKRQPNVEMPKDKEEPEKVKPVSHYRAAPRTPGLAPQVENNIVTTGMKIDAEKQSFEKYREKDISKRQPNAEIPKDKEEPEKVKPVSHYRAAPRTPGLAPQVENNIVTTGMKIDAEKQSFEKYRENNVLKRRTDEELKKEEIVPERDVIKPLYEKKRELTYEEEREEKEKFTVHKNGKIKRMQNSQKRETDREKK